jgi:hypothetical protein
MVRVKRKFKCSSCQKVYYRWQNFCTCGKSGTLDDVTPGLTEAQKKSVENRRIRQRSKGAERSISKVMAEADGEDPTFEKVASKNGRVGFINGMRIDAVSRSYVTEAKNRKLPTWLIKAWLQIQERGLSFQKHSLLYIQPPNMPAEFIFGESKIKSEYLHIITQARHEQLILKEKVWEEIFKNSPEIMEKFNEILDKIQNNVVRK